MRRPRRRHFTRNCSKRTRPATATTRQQTRSDSARWKQISDGIAGGRSPTRESIRKGLREISKRKLNFLRSVGNGQEFKKIKFQKISKEMLRKTEEKECLSLKCVNRNQDVSKFLKKLPQSIKKMFLKISDGIKTVLAEKM
jgi:hypothetical protein